MHVNIPVSQPVLNALMEIFVQPAHQFSREGCDGRPLKARSNYFLLLVARPSICGWALAEKRVRYR
jgi:hypothetical protein